MVQVDVFWSYALGASFAAAAARQIRKEESFFVNKYFIYTILYLACIFAPSGIYLLWQFPHWETMQVATSRADIPAWLVVCFSVTNITQGVLGFAVASYFARQGKLFAAHAQYFIGYFFMFFILIYGWDGTGWQRFLYDATVNDGVLWTPGEHMHIKFLWSNVSFTLVGMGFFVLPALFLPVVKWIRMGALLDPDVPQEKMLSAKETAKYYAAASIGVGFAAPFLCAVLCWILSWILGSALTAIWVGVPLFLICCRLFVFRKGTKVYELYEKLFIQEMGAP